MHSVKSKSKNKNLKQIVDIENLRETKLKESVSILLLSNRDL